MNSLPIDQRDGYIWFDGELVDWKQAKIHILTHSLHYGCAVFEGIRVYNRKPFKLDEHLKRFVKSAELLGFSIPFEFEKLEKACLDSIARNNIEAGYMRPLAWLGSETMLVSANNCKVHTMVAVWPSFEADRNNLRKRGVNLTVSNWRKPPANSMPYASKSSGSYMLATTIKNQAAKDGFDDALLLDNDGFITEATTSNFFFIKDGKLLTPEPRHILNGITRQTVIKIAKGLGISVVEGNFKIKDLKGADAAFLTGTAIEMMPIASITDGTEKYEFDIDNLSFVKIHDEFKKLTSN